MLNFPLQNLHARESIFQSHYLYSKDTSLHTVFNWCLELMDSLLSVHLIQLFSPKHQVRDSKQEHFLFALIFTFPITLR